MNVGRVDWEDTEIFFEDFGINAILEFNADPRKDPVPLRGILDTPYEKQDFGPVTLDAENPTFTTKWTDDIKKVRRGDYVLIGTERFTIGSAPQNDGSAICELPLVRGSLNDTTGDTFKTEVPADADTQDYTSPNGILGRRRS